MGGGLAAKGGALKQFTIAGKDRQFVPAEAAIDGGLKFLSRHQNPDGSWGSTYKAAGTSGIEQDRSVGKES